MNTVIEINGWSIDFHYFRKTKKNEFNIWVCVNGHEWIWRCEEKFLVLLSFTLKEFYCPRTRKSKHFLGGHFSRKGVYRHMVNRRQMITCLSSSLSLCLVTLILTPGWRKCITSENRRRKIFRNRNNIRLFIEANLRALFI